MDPLGAVWMARRFWAFLNCLFPFLSRLSRRAAAATRPWIDRTGLPARLAQIRGTPSGRAALGLAERFYWKDLSSHRADWESLPPSGLAVLRPVFLVSVALVLLLPLAMRSGSVAPPAAAEAPTAAGPEWCKALCLVAFAAAWGLLLAAAAASNRTALAVTAPLFLFGFGVAATAAPRSWWNLLAPAVALAALYLGERRATDARRRRMAAGTAVSLLVGAASGIVAVVFTPAGSLLHGRTALLLTGAAIGAPIGAVVMLAAGRARALRGSVPFPVVAASFAFWAATLASLGRIAWGGGLAGLSDDVFMMAHYWGGFLWPLWYYVGIGAVFAVLKTSSVLTEAIEDTVPTRLLAPVLLIALLAGLWITWSETILAAAGGSLAATAPAVLARATYAVARWTWAEPVRSFTSDHLRWVLAAAAAWAIWLAARRRLSSGSLGSLVFQVLLAWLAIYEYFFETVSLTRSHGHTIVFLFTFSLAMLWATHAAGLKFSLRSSPAWPQEGRVALYGSVLLFVLLAIHTRAALSDTRIVDEIFLSMLRGIVDVGLPVFLFAFAERRLRGTPLPARMLLGPFCLGAVWNLVLLALDKVIEARGSLTALGANLGAQVQAMAARGFSGGVSGRVPDLPVAWWLIRSLLFVAALVATARIARRRLAGREATAAPVSFATVAFAAGFASFAKTAVDLPLLPERASALISPYLRSLQIDANFIATYLSFLLPALVFVLGITSKGRGPVRRCVLAAGIAAAMQAAASALWPGREPWLRATGLGTTLVLAGAGLLVLLLRAMRGRVEEDLAPARGTSRSRVAAAFAAIVAVALGAAAVAQLRHGRMVPRTIEGLDQPLPVPESWTLVADHPAGALAVFSKSRAPGTGPRLSIRLDDVTDEGAVGLARRLAQEESRAAARFEPLGVSTLERFYPGAVALRYSYAPPGAATASLLATAVIVPRQDGRALVLTLFDCATVDEWERLGWDLAWIATELRRIGSVAPRP